MQGIQQFSIIVAMQNMVYTSWYETYFIDLLQVYIVQLEAYKNAY